jgi:NAD+ synthetase
LVWGKVRYAHRAARRDLEASEEDLRTMRLSVAAQLAEAYFVAVELRAQIRLLKRTIEARRAQFELVKRRYRDGMVTALDVYQARENLARVLAQRAAHLAKAPLVYVNQVGGNDGLIFDGRSFVTTDGGDIVATARAFGEDLITVELPSSEKGFELSDGGDDDLIEALALGVRDYVEKTGFRKVCLGLSGGIDSAVVAAIAAHGLGPERVVAISMPSRYSSQGTQNDARELAQRLGIEFHEIPIEDTFNALLDTLNPHFANKPADVTEENIQSRIRGTILMAMSNKFGYLVLNTGNKSELAVGYCTLYGDMVGGLAVIGDLPKNKVYAVARAFNRDREVIPESIITRPPSAELRPDQKDTDSLPDYAVLDRVVELYLEHGLDADEIKAMGMDGDVVDRIIHLLRLAEYKRRQAPMALKVTPKAFGPGRIFPIVQRFEG